MSNFDLGARLRESPFPFAAHALPSGMSERRAFTAASLFTATAEENGEGRRTDIISVRRQVVATRALILNWLTGYWTAINLSYK